MKAEKLQQMVYVMLVPVDLKEGVACYSVFLMQ
jgi:hypothetical protein